MQKITLFRRIILPLVVLGLLASIFSSVYVFNRKLNSIENEARDETNKIIKLLTTAKILVGEHVNSSMALLKQKSQALGAPAIYGKTMINGRELPNLVFGSTAQTLQVDLVDDITRIGSGTATLFVKDKNAFVRVSTNVRTKTGKRAFGTELDQKGKAIKPLLQGNSYFGVVDILGEPYISRYEPMFDGGHQLIGAWYVGYKVDMSALDQAIKNWRFLEDGFVAVTDYHQQIRFCSENVDKQFAQNILKNQAGWEVLTTHAPEWDFDIHIAYPRREAYLSSFGALSPIIILSLIFGTMLLILVLRGIQRFVLSPLGGDPETATLLLSRIEQGDFNDDGTEADPETLIGNMIKVRKTLRQMVNDLQGSADRLKLSSSVFEHAHDAIFITDRNGFVIEINPAATISTGYSREEAMGMTPDQLGLAYQDKHFFTEFYQSSQHEKEWRGEVWNKHKNGKDYLVWLDLFPVNNEAGQFQHYVGLFSDITEAKQQQKSLEHMAYHDALTQLPNRIMFSSRLQKTLVHAERNNELVAICYIDLDNFKIINDQHGHDYGDKLLMQLADRLSTHLGIHDTLARLGGDEFALLLCGHKSPKDYEKKLYQILNSIEKKFVINRLKFGISASIGYTFYPSDNNSPDTLLRHADHAMYHAKTQGGKQLQLFDLASAQNSQQQNQLLRDLEQAIKNDELFLVYQPQVNIQTGEVVCAEALVRWQHPERGLLMPGEFLHVIEHTNLIIDLGEWVLNHALQQIGTLNKLGVRTQIAVNIAAHHIMQKNFAKRLAAMLKQHPDASPTQLQIEITESAAIRDISSVTHIIKQSRKLGVSFAIDDFGAGYSSLIYLKRLPVDTIKIDRSFVSNMLRNYEDFAVVNGVISLCREFHRDAMAEGVESLDQARKLAEMGCKYAQGYGISKPMPASQLATWIQKNHPFALR